MSPTVQELFNWIVGGTNVSFVVIVLGMFFTGKIHSESEFKQLRADYDAERAAHDATRLALSASNERGDVAVKSAEIIVRALGKG